MPRTTCFCMASYEGSAGEVFLLPVSDVPSVDSVERKRQGSRQARAATCT